jgi:diaminohydroxyphosphoribosylaminopyrimidine deaminase/5-amino-6-(5-phosphoribosylamino)uracil reductase
MNAYTVQDRRSLLDAIELSRHCPPADTCYCVGAIVVAHNGARLAEGYSRENNDPLLHAEEAALAKLGPHADIEGATMVSTLEPCSTRRSRPRSCTELILASGIRRVVFGLREPSVFVDCVGAEMLRSAGIEVVEIEDLGPAVEQVNAQVLRRGAQLRLPQDHPSA